ncbi:hypothetical protein [Plastoroseomonas hellenica]|uniref:hypothetical protein n=1 Tax=Plastoroseomonas hellenica TaxID=2687306 RepID=UPI001BAD6892|nr:hypothetical protein [Plastoroseomonas hellenica]MBR0643949.1 hypothetical protein [Plastoroseomonas hellenica]
MPIPFPSQAAGFLCLALAACAPPAPGAADIAALSPDAALDARALPRGAAAARPTTVNVQADPASGAVLYTVSPRLRSGSPSNPPVIDASLGASRPGGSGAATYQALVTIAVPRAWRDFSQATGRDMPPIAMRRLGRSTDCQAGAGTCLYQETLLLDLPEAGLRSLAEAGRGLRLRIEGNAAFVETGLPAGHLRAIFEVMDRTASGAAPPGTPSPAP